MKVSRIITAVVSFVVTAMLAGLLVEFWLSWQNSREKWELDNQNRTTYTLQYESYSGKPLSSHTGLIKLQNHPLYVYRPIPHQKNSYFSINSLGLRSPEPVGSDDQVFRIAMIGGSTVFGTGLKSSSFTVAGELEKLLKNVEVINAGVVGYQTGNELALVKDVLIPEFKPDLILGLHGYNDYNAYLRTDDPKRELYFAGFEQQEDQLIWISDIRNAFIFKRVPYALASSLYPTLISRIKEGLIAAKMETRIEDRIATIEGFTRNFYKRLRQIKNAAELSGASFLSVLQINGNSIIFSDQGDLPDGFFHRTVIGYQRFAKLAESLSVEEGIPVYDQNRYSNRFKRSDFIDSHHFTESGSAVTAKIIAEILEEQKIFNRKEPEELKQ